jgi:hypothetical protein
VRRYADQVYHWPCAHLSTDAIHVTRSIQKVWIDKPNGSLERDVFGGKKHDLHVLAAGGGDHTVALYSSPRETLRRKQPLAKSC